MRINLKDKIKSRYFKSVTVLLSGTMIAQVMAFLVSPFMTRFFTEEAIGEYTLLLTASSMFGSIICGRYEMSIVTEQNISRIYALIKLCFILTFILSIICGIGYTAYVTHNEDLYISPFNFCILTIILLILTGVGHIASSYNNKYKEYTLLSKVNIIREGARDVILLGAGFLKGGVYGLITSQLVSLVFCLKKQFKKLIPHLKNIIKISRTELYDVAKLHKKQPIFSVPSIFANNFSYSILNVFIGSIYGLDMLAFYSMSFRILGLPIALLSVNVSRVFFERATHDYNTIGKFSKIYLKSSVLLIILSAPIMIVLALFAPQLFGFVFGNNWTVSGEMVVILMPMFWMRLVVGALTPAMIIIGKQHIDMIMQGLFVIAVLFLYVFCKSNSDIFSFLYYCSFIFSILYGFYYLIMLYLSSKIKKQQL